MVLPRRSDRPWVAAALIAFVTAFWLPRAALAQVPAAPLPGAHSAPATAIEKPFLWRIETPVPSYLFGTIHLPEERVTTLPKVVQEVLDSVDALYTEIPMDPGTMLKGMAAVMLSKGTTLRDVIGDEVYARVRRFLESKQQSMAVFDGLQPWALGMQLMLIDHLKEMASNPALEQQLATLRARRERLQPAGAGR